MNVRKIVIAAALLWTGMAQATCYSLYWADGVLASESSTPPVDLSLPLREALDARFGPGLTLVVSHHDVYCGRQEVVARPRSLADAVRAANEQAALVKKTELAATASKTLAR